MDKTQRSTDVALRKSPSVSARVYPEGTIMEGNDGNNWTITIDSNGVHRWAKINSSKVTGSSSVFVAIASLIITTVNLILK